MQVKLNQLARKVTTVKIGTLGWDRAIAQAAAYDSQLQDIQASADRASGRTTAVWKSAAVGGFSAFTIFKIAHLAVTAFGAQVAADAIGLTAFGIAAGAAIGPIISNWGTLTTTFSALDGYQKAAVISLQNYISTLAQGSEAGVFTIFNEGLSILRDFTGAGGVVAQATHAFEQFGAELNSVFTGPGWSALLHGTGGIVNKDLNALFGLITEIVQVLPSLVRGFNDVGLAIIGIVSHGVGFIGWLLSVNKGLSDVVARTGAVLTVWSLLAHFTPIIWPFQLLRRLMPGLAISTSDVGAAFAR